ncbi:MAG: nitrous oxide reductase family maturation protein NosD [Coriobacteriales bacterium]|nr:nitrous oxide reductase family maturation protein NosD [Coriobacteriales bacterium]
MGKKTCLIFALLFILIPAASASAAELEVGQDKPFATISSALDAAQDGDVIRVAPGVYTENLLINKAVTLESVERHQAVINGSYTRHVVEARDARVVIKGFTICSSGRNYLDNDAGILIEGASNSEVIDNKLQDVLFGIYVSECENVLLKDNSITGFEEEQFSKRGNGIHFFNTRNNLADGNVITATRDGIYFDQCDKTTVSNSCVTFVRYGLHYMSSDDNVFRYNYLGHNVSGAAIMFSLNITLDHNVFAENTGPRCFGLFFQLVSDGVIENNLFFKNNIGVYSDLSNRLYFKNNTMMQNDIGMEMLGSNWENVFTDNSFLDNFQQVSVNEIRTNDFWSHEGRGNYWSDYSGIDTQKDGVGDTAYRSGSAFEYSMYEFPFMRLFSESPTANLLKTVDAMFPVVKRAEIVDEFPLMHDGNTDLLEKIVSQKSTAAGVVTFAVSLCAVLLGVGFMRTVSRSFKK